MNRLIIIHYSELALKKGNRDYFENRLLRNINETMTGLDLPRARRISGRMLLEVPSDADMDRVKDRLARVFGIAYFGEGRRVGWDLDTITETAWELIRAEPFTSFRIDTRRPDKRFPMNSVELNRHVGAVVGERSGARVDLSNAERRRLV